MWWNAFQSLSLKNGRLTPVSDDSEDMLEITYPDGMMIDVGLSEQDKVYYITVVSADSPAAWKHPLLTVPVPEKSALCTALQKVVNQVRS